MYNYLVSGKSNFRSIFLSLPDNYFLSRLMLLLPYTTIANTTTTSSSTPTTTTSSTFTATTHITKSPIRLSYVHNILNEATNRIS